MTIGEVEILVIQSDGSVGNADARVINFLEGL
jgi:hypothetical protein